MMVDGFWETHSGSNDKHSRSQMYKLSKIYFARNFPKCKTVVMAISRRNGVKPLRYTKSIIEEKLKNHGKSEKIIYMVITCSLQPNSICIN